MTEVKSTQMDQQEEIRMDQEVMVWSCIMWIKAASLHEKTLSAGYKKNHK